MVKSTFYFQENKLLTFSKFFLKKFFIVKIIACFKGKIFIIFLKFIFERERDRAQAGEGAEREKETQNLKQAPGLHQPKV